MMLVYLAISPHTPDDARRLTKALEQLAKDDSALHVCPGQLPGEVVIGGTSDEHLEVVVDRLKREFRIEGSLGRLQGFRGFPSVACGRLM
jgi:elongation factor G